MSVVQLASTGACVFRTLSQRAEFFEAALQEFGSLIGGEWGGWSVATVLRPKPIYESLAQKTIEQMLVDDYRLQVNLGSSESGPACIDVAGERTFAVARDTLDKSFDARVKARHEATNTSVLLTSVLNKPMVLTWHLGDGYGAPMSDTDLSDALRHLIELFQPEWARAGSGGSKLQLAVSAQKVRRDRAGRPPLDHLAWVRDQPQLEDAPSSFSQENFADGLWLTLIDDDGNPIHDETLEGRALSASLHLARRARVGGHDLLTHLGLSLGNIDAVDLFPDGHIPGHRFNGERDNGDLVSLFGQSSPFERRPQLNFEEIVRQEARRQIRWSGDRNIIWLVTTEETVSEVDGYLAASEFDAIKSEYIQVPPLLELD